MYAMMQQPSSSGGSATTSHPTPTTPTPHGTTPTPPATTPPAVGQSGPAGMDLFGGGLGGGDFQQQMSQMQQVSLAGQQQVVVKTLYPLCFLGAATYKQPRALAADDGESDDAEPHG